MLRESVFLSQEQNCPEALKEMQKDTYLTCNGNNEERVQGQDSR